MGCDIHLHVEKYNERTRKWKDVTLKVLNDYYSPEDGDKIEEKYSTVWVNRADGRNYALFAILADVRNYAEDLSPIFHPRGIPNDASESIRKEHCAWESDAHSASYLTLKELIDAAPDYDEINEVGTISPEQSSELDKGNLPSSWCGGTNQEDWVQRSWVRPFTSLRDLITNIKLTLEASYSYSTYAAKDKPNYDKDYRIVFWFDN